MDEKEMILLLDNLKDHTIIGFELASAVADNGYIKNVFRMIRDDMIHVITRLYPEPAWMKEEEE